MKLGLETIRRQCTRASDAIRWACILEATAPKVGNVYPGRDFQDLSYLDFVAAAQLSASAFESPPETFSHGVLSACHAIAEQCGTNVNLGILLLLGPLAHADSVTGQTRSSRNELRMGVVRLLTQMGPDDASRLYAAINVASPGGMGETDFWVKFVQMS